MLISGEEMKADQAEGTGTEPVPEEAMVREAVQVVGTGAPVPDDDRSGEAPDLMEVDMTVRTGGSPVREEGAEARPDLGSGEGDLRMEDFPGDDFEKVGDFHPEEPSQTPPVPGSEQAALSPSRTEPRKKRFKTLAGRTDLPWVRKLQALRAKTSSSALKSSPLLLEQLF